MRAGKLDRTLLIERPTEIVGAAGTVTTTWAIVATVRAELVSNAAAETGQAFGEAENVTLSFRIRHLDGLSTKDRVTYEDRAYGLVSIVELGRRRALELRCEAVS